MQRIITNLTGTISRLLGCGRQDIVGVVGHSNLAVDAFLSARSFGMRHSSGPWVDMRATYYVATRSAASLLRQVQKLSRKQTRAGWRSAQPKRTEPRTARP